MTLLTVFDCLTHVSKNARLSSFFSYGRLQAEEAQLDRLRNDTAQAANHEATILGSLRGQISELQNHLNGMSHQLAAEQAMRRADGQVRGCRHPKRR